MKKIILIVALCFLPLAAMAQPNKYSAEAERIQQNYNKMTPEQQNKAKQDAYNKWQKMTPQQQQQARSKATQAWQNMTPEQRNQAFQQIRTAAGNMTPEQRANVLKEAFQMQAPQPIAQGR